MIWVDTQEDFDRTMARVAAEPVVAIDTEADSLHSYFDKVCLVQISIPHEDFVIDPLAKIDLARFGEILAEPAIVKIFHGGDYDVRILNRDFGFTITNLIDTMISAQILGYEAFGLAALLDRHFGLKLNKANQRADWAMRPLRPDMLDYAATDTRHLIKLRDILKDELEVLGRWPWALEEFARLEAVRYREKEEDDPEPFRRLKGIGAYDRRGLGVIRALYNWRDELARAADRPPFKIIGNDVILELGKEQPRSRDDLSRVKSLSRFHHGRYGGEIVKLVRSALETPEDQLPERGEPKSWIRDKALEARVERLKKVRDRVAAELKIDVAVLAPRHVLTAVATIQPTEVAQLDAIPAMREWQKKLLGEPFIAALAKPPQQMTL
jgi:ribonuclease D